MAQRNFPSNRIYNCHVFPVQLDCSVTIGASGAPTLVTSGPSGLTSQGIHSITRLAAGQYQIRLADNYSAMMDMSVMLSAPVTGSDVAATALTPGLVYQITALGTTTQANWVTAGVPSGITAQVGTVFKAAATSSGNGTAKILAANAATGWNLIGNPDLMLNSQPFVQGSGGGYITLETTGPTATADTAPIATDPSASTIMRIRMLLSNSSIS